MDATEALKLAEDYIEDRYPRNDMVVLADTVLEFDVGFCFRFDTRKHQETGRAQDMLIGTGLLLVERKTGEVHSLGSMFDLDYWIEVFRRGLLKPMTVIVTKVYDPQRAAEALVRLFENTFVISEKAHGEIQTNRGQYNLEDFRKSFQRLPVKFENQILLLGLREIEQIEAERDVLIDLVPESKTVQ